MKFFQALPSDDRQQSPSVAINAHIDLFKIL